MRRRPAVLDAVLAPALGLLAAAWALAVLGGLSLSIAADTPSGPSIVVAALALFDASLALPARG